MPSSDRADVIGVMDRPCRQPEQLALQLGENGGLGCSVAEQCLDGNAVLLRLKNCSGCHARLLSLAVNYAMFCPIPSPILAESINIMARNAKSSRSDLDDIDRRLLLALQQDGRLTVAELSEKVGLSASPCHRRVKLLEDRGIIERYVAVINQRSVGLPVSVFVSIKLESQREDALAKFAESHRAMAGDSRNAI